MGLRLVFVTQFICFCMSELQFKIIVTVYLTNHSKTVTSNCSHGCFSHLSLSKPPDKVVFLYIENWQCTKAKTSKWLTNAALCLLFMRSCPYASKLYHIFDIHDSVASIATNIACLKLDLLYVRWKIGFLNKLFLWSKWSVPQNLRAKTLFYYSECSLLIGFNLMRFQCIYYIQQTAELKRVSKCL